MVEAARILGWHDLRIPAAEAIGAVDLATIEAGHAGARRGRRPSSARPPRSSRQSTPGDCSGRSPTGYEDAVETLSRRAKIALDTRDFVELLPRFLGTGAERRYLLAIQTLGRPQGTGGEVDLIGVLTARDGVHRPRLPP